jgi:hypothetical protein
MFSLIVTIQSSACPPGTRSCVNRDAIVRDVYGLESNYLTPRGGYNFV